MKPVIRFCFNLLFLVLGSHLSASAWALSNGDALVFDPAEPVEGLGLPASGSYFAFEVGPNLFVSTPIKSFNGIVLGQAQAATGSHPGGPDGSESPDVDEPWAFFGNTGMHQTLASSNGVTVINNDGTGNYTLAFTAWGMTWNGIPNIPLGGDPAHIPADTGVAILNCSSPACQIGDSYVLNYQAHVPAGDPSGFGGVGYRLHLEGTVAIPPPILKINIEVTGGEVQECASPGGSNVEMTANTVVPIGDQVASISWLVDGTAGGSGTTILPFIALGSHTVVAILETKNGLTANDSLIVTVQDTTPPTIEAGFISTASSQTVTVVGKGQRVITHIVVQDACDEASEYRAVLTPTQALDVVDGYALVLTPNAGTNLNQFHQRIRLDVTASDASDNNSSGSATVDVQ